MKGFYNRIKVIGNPAAKILIRGGTALIPLVRVLVDEEKGILSDSTTRNCNLESRQEIEGKGS
jgi:hypothetical protein